MGLVLRVPGPVPSGPPPSRRDVLTATSALGVSFLELSAAVAWTLAA